jgi:Bacterial sugar transferase
MTIVGPRPFATIPSSVFTEQLSRISRHRNYKPGLIGWAQVNGYGDESDLFNVMRHRLELDLYYVDWSLDYPPTEKYGRLTWRPLRLTTLAIRQFKKFSECGAADFPEKGYGRNFNGFQSAAESFLFRPIGSRG